MQRAKAINRIKRTSLSIVCCCLIAQLGILCGGCTKTANSEDNVLRYAQSKGVRQTTITASVNISGAPRGWSCVMVRAGEPRDSFTKIQFADSRAGWAAAEAGGIAKTSDGGKTWVREAISLPFGAYIRSMWLSTAERAWLLIQRTPEDYLDYKGSESWVMHTSDSGRVWDVQSNGAALELYDVLFPDQKVGWIVGGRRTKRKILQSDVIVLRTTDQGQSWTDLSEPLNRTLGIPPDSDAVVAVCKTSAGGMAILTAERRLLVSAVGSDEWRQVLELEGEPQQTIMQKLGQIDKERFWLSGGADSIEGRWGLLLLMESASSATNVRVPGVFFKDVVSLSEKKFLACGSISADSGSADSSPKKEGIILYSEDGGKNWSLMVREPRVSTIKCLSIIDENHIWASADHGFLFRLSLTKSQ